MKMIEKLTLQRFKRFRDQEIPLTTEGVILVAGANNTGKSTILHALAVWEFCRTILQAEKGFGAFLPDARVQGLGMAADEFSPILVPSLSHLWTNLSPQKQEGDPDGYTLRITATWRMEETNEEKELGFGLALANDRMFVKTTQSNIKEGDKIPKAAYLPTVAGITDRETRLPGAIRRRRIGEGLAGRVLRNILLDLYLANQKKRAELRGDKKKISDSALRSLRQNDPWELLQQALRFTFHVELVVFPFREEYHSHIKVKVAKGSSQGHRFSRFTGYKPRDLMVEGSGFLQWLSVYALATDPSIDVLLLDEPDAHLHSSLQRELVDKLEDIASHTNKQVLIATHSSEILRHSQPSRILEVRANKGPRFLTNDSHKVGLLAGLGSEYAPKLDKLKASKRLLLVEGDFDVRIMRRVAEKKDISWPDCWVEWKNVLPHKDRKHLFNALSEEVDELTAVSLRDRDDEPPNTVDENLTDKIHKSSPKGFYCKKWKRRNIESYLISPLAMAAASESSVEAVSRILEEEYGVAISRNFVDHEQPDAILNIDGKEVLKRLGIDRHHVLEHMSPDEIPRDLVSMVEQLVSLADN